MSAAPVVSDEPSSRPLIRRLLQLAVVVVVVVVGVSLAPGLGTLRDRIGEASGGWLAAGVGLELLSALSYVLVFRAVFCRVMSWRVSYQIGMAEQGANSVLAVGGAGGLALGAWALHRGGMGTELIGRRTVAFFVLTSLANVAGGGVFAALYGVGGLHGDPDTPLTYALRAAARAAALVVLALPLILERNRPDPTRRREGRLAAAARFARDSLAQGVRIAVVLLRERSFGVIAGSLGWMAFDIAVLAVCFRAVGISPSIGVLVLGYL